MLEILDTRSKSAEENMRLDEKILNGLDPSQKPILHLYRWKNPSLTYGYFIDPKKYLDVEKANALGIDMARRPTGGGIVFHIWDLAFSFFLPSKNRWFSQNTLANYGFVNKAVLQAVQEIFPLPFEMTKEDFSSQKAQARNFCMALPTRYDVVYQGVKVAGAAQRKKAQGLLHQGTISLLAPKEELLSKVLKSSSIVESMLGFSFAPLFQESDLETIRSQIEKLLADKLLGALESPL